MTINREELSRLARQFPLVRDYDNDSDRVAKNTEAAIWFLKNRELFFELLIKYRRITEITFEGEKLSE